MTNSTSETHPSPPAPGPPTSVCAGADGVGVVTHLFGGEGPPVVLVHAAGLHGRVWEPVTEPLSAHFTCVAPDLRGHGDTAAPPGEDFDWRGFATDVLAVVDGLGLERPFGVGHSSGATALLLAEQARPGLFRALYCYEPVIVPADPPLGPDPDNWLAERTRTRRATFPSRDDALRHYIRRPPLPGLHPAALRAYVDHGVTRGGGGTARLKCRPDDEAAIYVMATAHDGFPRLGEVRCPVVVARGGRSEAFSARHVEEIAGRLPDARTDEHPDLGHTGPLEAPDAVAATIIRAFAAVA